MKRYLISIICMAILLLACKEKKAVALEPPTKTNSKLNQEIQQMVNAINAYDVAAIEGLRDQVKKEHIDILITLWDADQSWTTKNGFTFLMCDQSDKRLRPMMVDALDAPLIDSQAYGLCFLQGINCDFDSLIH